MTDDLLWQVRENGRIVAPLPLMVPIRGKTCDMSPYGDVKKTAPSGLEEGIETNVDGHPVGPHLATSTGAWGSSTSDRSRAEANIRQFLAGRGLLRMFRTFWDMYRVDFESLANWIEMVMIDCDSLTISLPNEPEPVCTASASVPGASSTGAKTEVKVEAEPPKKVLPRRAGLGLIKAGKGVLKPIEYAPSAKKDATGPGLGKTSVDRPAEQ